MSGNPGDKPFAPTEHKLREARKRGEVPKVQDLPMIAAGLAVAMALWAASTWLLQSGRGLLDRLLTLAFATTAGSSELRAAAGQAALLVLHVSAPLLLLGGVVGTLTKFLLTGAVFSAKPLKPDLKRMNPIQGLQRLFSAPTWVQLVKSILAVALVLTVLAFWIRSRMRDILRLSETSDVLMLGIRWWLSCVFVALLVLLVVSMVDALYQRYAFRRQMRMDKKDLMDEFKRLEGNPEQKAERRAEHKRMAAR